MNHAEQIERAIKELHVTTNAETDKRILDDAFTALEQSVQKQPASIWRMIVTSRITELAAVAAVVLIAFALFFRAPAAKAVSLSQIYEALEKVRNVCVSRFRTDETEPYQQVWTSEMLKVRLLKAKIKGQIRFVLWDVPNKVKKTRYSLSGPVSMLAVSKEDIAKVENTIMTGTFGLIPFSDIKVVPKDYG